MPSKRHAVHAALALGAAILCWIDVSWALKPGLFPMLDEIGTKAAIMPSSYSDTLHLLPRMFYADRPLGWAFIKWLDGRFGFDYRSSVACLLALHFANCALAFWMFRKLGAAIPLAIAGVAFFGSLWTTAETATYLGEAFDLVCLFFLLGSILAILYDQRIASAALFLLALRSKEFAIMTPLLLALLLMLQLQRLHLFREVLRRLWLHFAIFLVYVGRYAYLYGAYRAAAKPDNPYRMDFHLSTVVQSLGYYLQLIFGEQESSWHIPAWILTGMLAVVFVAAVVNRWAGVAFGIAAFFLTALPVLLMLNIRAAYWVYAPQLFLILAITLLIEMAIARIWRGETSRWIAGVVVAVICFAWCGVFRTSVYFRDRVNWNYSVRGISARTAREIDAKLPRLPHGAHVFIDHAPDTPPWIFIPGPCSYLQVLNRDPYITCVLDRAREAYDADVGSKYLLSYHDDGSMTVR